MLASRSYYATVCSSIIHLDYFLASLIILGVVLAANLIGPTIANPQTQLLPAALHGIKLVKIAFILACSALSSLILSFVLTTHALADLNSKMARENAVRKQRGYADVVMERPSFAWFLGVFTCMIGVSAILAAVAMSIASAVNEHNYSFIACVIILGVAVVLGILIALFLILTRNETVGYGVGNYSSGGPYTSSPAQFTGAPTQYSGAPAQYTGSPVSHPAP